MTEKQFLDTLSQMKKAYRFILKGKEIKAKARNGKVAGQFLSLSDATKRFTRNSKLEMPNRLYQASRGTAQHGHAQVLRGRIRQAVGV